jgi:hypothetical protein
MAEISRDGGLVSASREPHRRSGTQHNMLGGAAARILLLYPLRRLVGTRCRALPTLQACAFE